MCDLQVHIRPVLTLVFSFFSFYYCVLVSVTTISCPLKHVSRRLSHHLNNGLPVLYCRKKKHSITPPDFTSFSSPILNLFSPALPHSILSVVVVAVAVLSAISSISSALFSHRSFSTFCYLLVSDAKFFIVHSSLSLKRAAGVLSKVLPHSSEAIQHAVCGQDLRWLLKLHNCTYSHVSVTYLYLTF